MLFKKMTAVSPCNNFKVVLEPYEAKHYKRPGEYIEVKCYQVFIYDLRIGAEECIEDYDYDAKDIGGFCSDVLERFGIKEEDFYEIP